MAQISAFKTRRTIMGAALGALMVAALPVSAQQAANFPSKPITFVVPFAAGSATDLIARALGQAVTQSTGQSVIVENKGGASGMIAAQAAARAPAPPNSSSAARDARR